MSFSLLKISEDRIREYFENKITLRYGSIMDHTNYFSEIQELEYSVDQESSFCEGKGKEDKLEDPVSIGRSKAATEN